MKISWYDFTHPDKDAIARRDAFLNQSFAHNIKFNEEGISAEVDINIKENDKMNNDMKQIKNAYTEENEKWQNI